MAPAPGRAGGRDRAAVARHHFADQGQAQAEPAAVAVGAAGEALEDAVRVGRREADARVADPQLHVPLVRHAQPHLDRAARWGVAQGVVQQRRKHAPQRRRDALDDVRPPLARHREPDLALARAHRFRRDRLLGEHAQLDRLRTPAGPHACADSSRSSTTSPSSRVPRTSCSRSSASRPDARRASSCARVCSRVSGARSSWDASATNVRCRRSASARGRIARQASTRPHSTAASSASTSATTEPGHQRRAVLDLVDLLEERLRDDAAAVLHADRVRHPADRAPFRVDVAGRRAPTRPAPGSASRPAAGPRARAGPG